MQIHSTLKRFVCLTVVLAASAVGVAFEAQAGGGMKGGGGLKVGAASSFVASNRAQVQVSATAVLSGTSGQYVRPGTPVRPTGGSGSPCGKGGCPKR
jgi:hypothetical protein